MTLIAGVLNFLKANLQGLLVAQEGEQVNDFLHPHLMIGLEF